MNIINIPQLLIHAQSYNQNTLRQIFLLSSHFGVASSRNHRGTSPFLTLFGDPPKHFDVHRGIQKIDFLLAHGGDINDYDYKGSNCLHLILSKTWLFMTGGDTWKSILIHLLNKGA